MKKGFFISILTLGLAATIFVFSDFTYQRQYVNRNASSSMVERGICGAIEWRMLQRNEFGTGALDIRYVTEAREYARQYNMAKFEASDIKWDERGPDNQGGRTRAFLIDKDNHNRMYAAGVAGGIWYSNNAGQSWFVVDDFMDNIIISSITQAANGVIYVGTGEDFAPLTGCENGSTGFEGYGMYKSTDGGQTFQHMESTWGNTALQNTWIFVQEVAAHPTNANRIYAATKRGLQVSDDGGDTWFNPVKNAGGSPNTATAQDVVVASDGTVLAVVGNRVYVSPNGNEDTFELKSGIAEGLISTSSGRIEVAISPSDPNYMYASSATSSGALAGIYQSTDKGQTWELIGPGGSSFFQPYGTQGTYNNAIRVDATNPDKILLGGINVWKWATGQTWTELTQWFFSPLSENYVHADVHAFVYHPTQPNRVYVTNDGGVGYSTDGGETWSVLNRNYVTTQFYTIACAAVDVVMGGTQDNGTLVVGLPGNTEMSSIEVSGGDGAGCAFSNIEPSVLFTSSQNGSLQRSPNEGSSFDYFYGENIADLENGLNFNTGISAPFINPIAYWEGFNNDGSPADTCMAVAFAGGNGGIFITREALRFDRVPEWYRVMGSISGFPNVIKFSDDGDVVLLGTTGGKLYRVTNLLQARDSITGNFNSSGALVESAQIASYSQCITGIDIHPTDHNKVLITLGSYGNTSYVRYSTNAMAADPNDVNFNSKQGSAPRFPFYSCIIDVTNPNRVFVGTEGGVYMAENINAGSPQWVPVFGPDNGLANVPVYDMVQQRLPYSIASNHGVIYAGTHGRGIWSTGSLVLGQEEKEKQKASTLNASLYPNPVSGNIASLNFTLEQANTVTIDIYSLSGALVKRIDVGNKAAGNHSININTADINAGSYFMNLQAGDITKTNKFVVLK